MTAATTLAPLTLYTATITGATSLAAGTAFASPYTWQFTTGAAPVAPTVTAVAPVNIATGVSLNTTVTAEFSEPMAPIAGAASFKLTCLAPCTNPTGTLTLDATGRNATLTPSGESGAAAALYRNYHRCQQSCDGP